MSRTTNTAAYMAWMRGHGEQPETPTGPDTPLRQRLYGTVPFDTLDHVLDQVRGDPAWFVLAPFDRPPERLVQLVYRPTGTPYCFRAVQVDGGWQFLAEA